MRAGVVGGSKVVNGEPRRGGLYRTRQALGAINPELEHGYQDAIDVYANLMFALTARFPFGVTCCKWMGRGKGSEQQTPLSALRRQSSEPQLMARVQLMLSVEQSVNEGRGVITSMIGTPPQE